MQFLNHNCLMFHWFWCKIYHLLKDYIFCRKKLLWLMLYFKIEMLTKVLFPKCSKTLEFSDKIALKNYLHIITNIHTNLYIISKPLHKTLPKILCDWFTLSFDSHTQYQMGKKSHTSEEGGAQLKISFWHLLMNLKIKYLLKKTVEVGQ